MKLEMTALVDDSWEGALLVQRAKDNLIEEQIAAGHMMRLPCGKVVVTMAGCNAYQEELDAEYAATVTASNNARLVNSLVSFKR